MKKLLIIVITLVVTSLYTSAQYVDQALMFSQQYYGSTARAKAMGGAFGALGGDFSSLSTNPAGIAVYRKSEMSITPTVYLNNTKSTVGGATYEDSKYNFNLNNFGYVAAYTREDGGSISSLNFGFGLNRLNNFNQNSLSQLFGSQHSRMDAFVENTNGIHSTDLHDDREPYYNGIPWESKMAWETYLIDVANPDEDGQGDKYRNILYDGELVNQINSIQREGYINEYLFALGANFGHKFYIGATVGIQDLFYLETSSYTEWGDFGRFDYFDYARTSGLGVNAKIGAILRPFDGLRLGAAFHTPTFYDLKESYNGWMSSETTDGNNKEETPYGDYKYKLETPYRAIFSAAYQFGKFALLSADYEYVDYRNIKLRNGRDGYDFYDENAEIKEIYRATNVIRVGGEIRASKTISIRGGYEHYDNPYNVNANGVEQPNVNYSNFAYTGGLGFRFKNGSFDIAYSLSDRTSYSYIYQLSDVTVESVKYNSMIHELMFTFAFRF
jgi:hypothetical protein